MRHCGKTALLQKVGCIVSAGKCSLYLCQLLVMVSLPLWQPCGTWVLTPNIIWQPGQLFAAVLQHLRCCLWLPACLLYRVYADPHACVHAWLLDLAQYMCGQTDPAHICGCTAFSCAACQQCTGLFAWVCKPCLCGSTESWRCCCRHQLLRLFAQLQQQLVLSSRWHSAQGIVCAQSRLRLCTRVAATAAWSCAAADCSQPSL